MGNKNVVIIEDERDMADLVALRLQREHFDVEVARDGIEGLEKIQQSPPDLVLLDIMLPRMSGLDVLTELRRNADTATVPVILLTAKTEEGDIVAGLHLGADDYVCKPFSMSVLVARISAVLRRAESAPDDDAGILQAGPIRVNQDTHHVDVDGQSVSLTLTEFRLLSAVLSARGRVLTRDRLIDRAIGPDAVVTDRTIDVHLTALRRKLGHARRYIETVRGVGYRLGTGEDETA